MQRKGLTITMRRSEEFDAQLERIKDFLTSELQWPVRCSDSDAIRWAVYFGSLKSSEEKPVGSQSPENPAEREEHGKPTGSATANATG